MKLGFVNKGNDFELPEKPLTVRDDREILIYMSKQDKDLPVSVRNITEFTETVFRVLNKIDSTVTRDMIDDNLTTEEIGVLYALFRSKDVLTCDCPFCGKQYPYSKLFEKKKENIAGDKNFQEQPKNDTTGTS